MGVKLVLNSKIVTLKGERLATCSDLAKNDKILLKTTYAEEKTLHRKQAQDHN
jgi:hypothetical protein